MPSLNYLLPWKELNPSLNHHEFLGWERKIDGDIYFAMLHVKANVLIWQRKWIDTNTRELVTDND